jgi:hypothetical protein
MYFNQKQNQQYISSKAFNSNKNTMNVSSPGASATGIGFNPSPNSFAN